jgi:predicted GNAT family acetyltransferase
MNENSPVVDNAAAGRFELTVDGRTAFAAYDQDGRAIVFTHTEVPGELRGKGVGSALARGALAAARARNAEVVPLCPFIASFIRAHPEYLDLVSAHNRRRLKLEQTNDRT